MSPYESAVQGMAALAPVHLGGHIRSDGTVRRWARISRRVSREEAVASAAAWWLRAHEIGGRFSFTPLGDDAELEIVYDGMEVPVCVA